MISCAKTIRSRLDYPVDIATNETQQLPSHHRYFTGINAIRTEDETTATFGALEEIIEPFFQNFFGEFPGSSELSKDLPGEGEISPIDRAEKLGPQDGHILRISGADEEVTFIRTRPASDADVEKEAEGPIPV